jgi:hypothetical protein
VVGVNVRESEHQQAASFEELQQKVASFVQTMGDKMDFNICMDAKDKPVFTAWMTAAGMRYIPTVFVVDKQGKIAWIGHPDGTEVDQVIEQLLAGKYDYKAAKASFQKDTPR